MEQIKDILKQKLALASELKQKKEEIKHSMANPKLVNDINDKIRDAEKQLEMIGNIMEISEEDDNINYKKGLRDLKEHYKEEIKHLENTDSVAKKDKASVHSQLNELNENLKTVEAMDKQPVKDTPDFDIPPSFLDDID